MSEIVDFFGMDMKVPNVGEGPILEGALLCLKTFEGPLDVVIDIGAHAGGFAVYAVHKGAKKVLAYEADAKNFKCLKENIDWNGFNDIIEPHHRFVAATTDDVYPLYDGNQSGMHSLYWGSGSNSALRGNVKTIAFKDILRSLDNIDYLKIDVEGAEFEFIEGTDEMRTLLQRVAYLDIQYHPQMLKEKIDDDALGRLMWNLKTCEEDLREFFKSCGFHDYYGGWNKKRF